MSFSSPLSALNPKNVVVAGDWHGNTRWAYHVIDLASKLLVAEDYKIILHAGDFGIWPGKKGSEYVNALIAKCASHDVRIFFVDGNHEDFTQLPAYSLSDTDLHTRWLTHLPRGYRWQWRGHSWLALGGARSVDRSNRVPGIEWWPDEAVTRDQAEAVMAGGLADVMLTHDVGSRVPLTFDSWPDNWDIADKARAEAHRELMQDVADVVQPVLWLHGHYHQYRVQQLAMNGYDVDVISLDMDGEDGNVIHLDTETLRYVGPLG